MGEGFPTHNHTRNSWVIPQLPSFSKWLQHALIIDTDNLEDTIAYNDPMQDAAIDCPISRKADDNNTMHETTKEDDTMHVTNCKWERCYPFVSTASRVGKPMDEMMTTRSSTMLLCLTITSSSSVGSHCVRGWAKASACRLKLPCLVLSSAISCRSSICLGRLSTAWLVSLVVFSCHMVSKL